MTLRSDDVVIEGTSQGIFDYMLDNGIDLSSIRLVQREEIEVVVPTWIIERIRATQI